MEATGAQRTEARFPGAEQREMTSNFSLILDILSEAFRLRISEADYHRLMVCLIKYKESRENVCLEQDALADHSFPMDYDPCVHMERFRFVFTFGSRSDGNITKNLDRLMEKLSICDWSSSAE